MSMKSLSICVYPYIIAASLSSTALLAKGLDTLQADTQSAPPAETPPAAPTPSSTAPADQAISPTNTVPAPNPAPATVQTPLPSNTLPASTEVERFYLASSFSWINLSGSKGDWATGTTGDLEGGYRFRTIQKFDLFGTIRYRPVEAIVNKDWREYRGIVETFLFGIKGRMAVNSKLAANASAELGMSQTHMNPSDSLATVDESLEKSGVDLTLGGGVSYLVLEKFAVGGKLLLGAGAYKSVQLGVDLRFML